MKNFKYAVLTLTVFGGAVASGAAWAAQPASGAVSTAALIQRLEDLEQEVALLKRQLEVQKEIEDKKAIESPVITANANNGFSIKSPDDAFKLRIGGYLQTDARLFTDNDKSSAAAGTTDTFTMRRIRPTFEGTVAKNFDFRIMPSFDQGTAALQDAYLDYRYAPELKFRAGRFKSPFGLERLQSNATTSFVETAYPTGLTPNYDIGFQVFGDVQQGVVSYAVALANGTSDGAASDTDTNNDKEIAARLMFSPFKLTNNELLRGLSAGAAVTHGHKEGTGVLPTLRSPGQASIFSYASGVFADGPHTRLSPQLSWYYGQFGLLSEYVTSDQQLSRGAFQDKFENRAWQIAGTYVITGEDASPKGVTPLKNFDPAAGTWGAWEIAGRYHELDVDDSIFTGYPNGTFANASSAVSDAASWTIGTNWYLSKNLRLQFDFEHTEFSGGNFLNGAFADRPDENAVLSRFQLAY